jgi:anti-sigma regulatory factor (Ser/Thr protein kinase)
LDKLNVWVDRKSIDKVVDNLLSNAFKYTYDNGEIEVSVSETADGMAKMEVIDNGMGIRGDVNRLFERFYQGSSSSSLHIEGTGIGLNLCKMIVQMHHGTIEAANREDMQGSIFTVLLPLGTSHLTKEELSIQDETERSAKSKPKAQSNYRVLVVDDDGLQAEHWLSTFVADHRQHPTDIIYGMSMSRVFLFDGKIVDDYGNIPHTIQIPGEVSTDKKPASGASGTLYPAHTFTDPRFFDRKLLMRLSPTSDEVWSFAFAKMARRTFRCLSQCNYPQIMDSNQDVALFKANYGHYNEIHNAIAQEFPEYVESLKTEL